MWLCLGVVSDMLFLSHSDSSEENSLITLCPAQQNGCRLCLILGAFSVGFQHNGSFSACDLSKFQKTVS